MLLENTNDNTITKIYVLEAYLYFLAGKTARTFLHFLGGISNMILFKMKLFPTNL